MPNNRVGRAVKLDQQLVEARSSIVIRTPQELFLTIRTYLQRVVEGEPSCRKSKNNPIQLVKFSDRVIALGPPREHGPTDSHFHFDSGARLAFEITLMQEGADWRLQAYRFHLELPEGMRPQYFRFDMDDAQHSEPLRHPRSHIHPGNKDVRLPCPVLHPLDVLDYLIFVLEPFFAAAPPTRA